MADGGRVIGGGVSYDDNVLYSKNTDVYRVLVYKSSLI